MPIPLITRWHTVQHTLAALAAFAAVVTTPVLASASLGGDVASVRTDADQLRGTHTVSSVQSYEVHEIRTPDGFVIHEYLSPGGRVFAIAWSGQRVPNLRQLLGASFDDYVTLARQNHGGHHTLSVASSILAVQAMGHNHSFAGRAWLLGVLPAGFDTRTVR